MDEELRQALRTARAIRFLCTGNVVRSAFAELYARHRGCPLPVDSAATVYQNPGLFPETRAALAARGVAAGELDAFRPRFLKRVGATDPEGLVVFGMTREHLRAWSSFRPDPGPLFLLSAVAGSRAGIADPVLDGASFDATFGRVGRLVDALLEELRAV